MATNASRSCAILGGVATIRFRKPLNDAMLRNYEGMFGQRMARSIGRQSPRQMGMVGVGIILLGVLMLGFAVTGAVQNLGA